MNGLRHTPPCGMTDQPSGTHRWDALTPTRFVRPKNSALASSRSTDWCRYLPCPSLRAAVLTTMALLLATGCSIPIPQASADPTRFFVLSTNSGAATPAATGAPVVHLGEVELATYLRARPIVIRRGDNEIEFREFAIWGEPLEQGVRRVLREELITTGAAGAVLTSGSRAANSSSDRELKVRVLAAEGTATGGVNFRAVWELNTAGAKAEPIARGDFRASGLTWDGTSEAMLVAKLSEAVAGLAKEISAALRK
jgi:uncharacterized protein